MKVKDLIEELAKFSPTEDVFLMIQESDDLKEEREIVTLRMSLNGIQIESEAKRWSN